MDILNAVDQGREERLCCVRSAHMLERKSRVGDKADRQAMVVVLGGRPQRPVKTDRALHEHMQRVMSSATQLRAHMHPRMSLCYTVLPFFNCGIALHFKTVTGQGVLALAGLSGYHDVVNHCAGASLSLASTTGGEEVTGEDCEMADGASTLPFCSISLSACGLISPRATFLSSSK